MKYYLLAIIIVLFGVHCKQNFNGIPHENKSDSCWVIGVYKNWVTDSAETGRFQKFITTRFGPDKKDSSKNIWTMDSFYKIVLRVPWKDSMDQVNSKSPIPWKDSLGKVNSAWRWYAYKADYVLSGFNNSDSAAAQVQRKPGTPYY